MCYGRLDEVLKETEEKWVKAVVAHSGTWIDRAMALWMLDWKIGNAIENGRCCGDVLVELADDIERLESWSGSENDERLW